MTKSEKSNNQNERNIIEPWNKILFERIFPPLIAVVVGTGVFGFIKMKHDATEVRYRELSQIKDQVVGHSVKMRQIFSRYSFQAQMSADYIKNPIKAKREDITPARIRNIENETQLLIYDVESEVHPLELKLMQSSNPKSTLKLFSLLEHVGKLADNHAMELMRAGDRDLQEKIFPDMKMISAATSIVLLTMRNDLRMPCAATVSNETLVELIPHMNDEQKSITRKVLLAKEAWWRDWLGYGCKEMSIALPGDINLMPK